MKYQTLTEAFADRSGSRHSICHIEGERNERTISFPQLRQRAAGLLHHIQSHGVEPGTETILLLDNNQQFIDAFWACLLGGIIPVPIAPGTNEESRRKFFRVLQCLRRPHLCSDRRTFDRLASFAAQNGYVSELKAIQGSCTFLDEIDDVSRTGLMHEAKSTDTALIQFSSGSTSEPKGVVLTHRNILTNIDAIARAMALDAGDSALSWMPLTHDMGLIGFHLTWLVNDIAHALMPTALFVRRPSLWLLKASEKRASLLCSPNFGYRHFLKSCSEDLIAKLNLSTVRLIFNGAEPISVELCREFMRQLAPTGLKPNAMFPVYGLAEASLAVAFPKPGAPFESVTVERASLSTGDSPNSGTRPGATTLELACVGRPIPNCEIRIADDLGHTLPNGSVGRILIRGDNVTASYYGAPMTTLETISAEGWLDTGDMGFESPQGLVVTGRRKEILFVHGQNYYPQDIEALLDRLGVVELGRAAAASSRPANAESDEVLVFILHRGALEAFTAIAAQARKCINEHIGIAVTRVVPVNSIPKTTSGKIQRYLLAQQYLNGEFESKLAELDQLTSKSEQSGTNNNIERTLKEVCDTFIRAKPLGLNDNIFEAGTSSLTLAQIYQRIDSLYPGAIEVTDFFDYPTISELARYLEKRTTSS